MTMKEICEKYNLKPMEIVEKFKIPRQSVYNWYCGYRKPPEYVLNIIVMVLERDKTIEKLSKN